MYVCHWFAVIFYSPQIHFKAFSSATIEGKMHHKMLVDKHIVIEHTRAGKFSGIALQICMWTKITSFTLLQSYMVVAQL